MRFARQLLALALAVAGGGCEDTDKPQWRPTDGPRRWDGNVPFLGACASDGDCESGRCATLGTSKRCTRRCTAATVCPAFPGWSCGSESWCECKGGGKEPNVCGVDGDCDGLPDKPAAAEICNKEDDDCNGKIDDVAPGTAGAKLYYRDADGDGHGDQNQTRWSCAAEPGWVDNKSDCDDTRKDVNPAMTEVCGDGIDHNCNGAKEDPDICGLTPIVVTDVNDPQQQSATLKSCGTSSAIDKSLDITEIVAKQDKDLIKFTVRLAGAPATATCSSYALHLGTFAKSYELVLIYRPAIASCGGLAESEAYLKGQKFATKATMSFNAADPGHVAFTIPKAEYFPSLSTPSYYLKACTNAKADAVADLTVCADDSCETPVHR
jgi:hypothetical protein